MKKLTIFTPAYNRAHTLPRLYQSLITQTNKNFCWLIVDDGSSDNTQKIIDLWKKENKIDITYIKQENSGKMQAHNTGVLNAKTKFFVCVDSDDYITGNAVEKILLETAKIENDEKICGIVAYKGQNENETLGGKFPNVKFSTLEGLYDMGFEGDTTLVYKTEVLKEFLFPKFNGEKFIPEAYIYTQIDQKYKLKVVPEILTICEYMDDGLTKNRYKNFRNNAYSMSQYYNLRAKCTKKFKNKIKWTIGYICYAIIAKRKDKFKNASNKLLFILLYPFGWLLSIKRKKV